jgi:hypothetical protein
MLANTPSLAAAVTLLSLPALGADPAPASPQGPAPQAPAQAPRNTLPEAPNLPLGLSVAEFTAQVSSQEVSVSERGRRRFELNPSSLPEGVQSVSCDFIDNKLAMVVVTYPSDVLFLPAMSRGMSTRGTPTTWPALTGTSLFERRVVEESVAWKDDSSVLAYLREASSSGARLMVVIIARDRFEVMQRDGLLTGAGRQFISLNLSNLTYGTVDLQYARAATPSVAWLVGLELTPGYSWLGNIVGERLAGTNAWPVLAGNVGVQWYPSSGGAPKGFYLEGKGRLALTSEGYYSGVSGKLGYNFVFANGFAFGLSTGLSYMPDRSSALLPVGSIDIGWAP